MPGSETRHWTLTDEALKRAWDAFALTSGACAPFIRTCFREGFQAGVSASEAAHYEDLKQQAREHLDETERLASALVDAEARATAEFEMRVDADRVRDLAFEERDECLDVLSRLDGMLSRDAIKPNPKSLMTGEWQDAWAAARLLLVRAGRSEP